MVFIHFILFISLHLIVNLVIYLSIIEKEKEKKQNNESWSTFDSVLSPLWVFTCDHEAAAVGQLVDGLSVVLQCLLQRLVLLHHYKCTLLILQSNRELFWLLLQVPNSIT